MAKDFAAIDRAYNEAGIQGTEAGSNDVLVNKFVKAWENQTARRAVKGGTGLTMALTLAACGGSGGGSAVTLVGPAPVDPAPVDPAPVDPAPVDPVVVPTLSVAEAIEQAAAGSLPEQFNIEVADANFGPATVAEFDAVSVVVNSAQNADEFIAAAEAGTIAINVTVADTAANIVEAAADLADSPATVAVTDESVAVSITAYQTLATLGATFAEGVVPSISDNAANIVAAAAELVDADGVAIAAIAVTDAAPVVDVAQLATLNELAVSFVTAPDVVDTLVVTAVDDVLVAEAVVIDGANDVSLTVESPTAAADTISLDIVAQGAGTISFDFTQDENDTVTLTETSSITGFTTLVILNGSVDVAAATIGADVEQVTVSSGVVLTGEQFLALDGGIVGGSETSTVTIEVSTLVEANAVIAAVTNFGGTLDATSVTLTVAEGGSVSLVNIVTLNGQLSLAFDAAEAAEQAAAIQAALPGAIATLQAAEAAQDAFVDAAVEGAMIDGLVDGLTFSEVATAISTEVTNQVDVISGYDPVAYGTPATVTAGIIAVGAALDEALADANADVVAAELAVDDPNLIGLADDYLAALASLNVVQLAELSASQATGSAIDAVTGASISYENGTLDIVVGQVEQPFATIDLQGNIQFVGLAVEPGVGTYTIYGIELDSASIDAVVAAAQVEYDAEQAIVQAGAFVTGADDDLAAGVAADQDVQGLVSAYLDASFAAIDAQALIDAFDADVADYNALVALDAQADALTDDLTDAVAAIENAPDAVAPVEAGLGINVVGYDTDADDGLVNDLYIYDDANPVFAGGFGVSGTDYFYFGTEYTYVEVDASELDGRIDEAISGPLGSSTALEVFAVSDGLGTVVYVENVATAGNGTTEADLTEVVSQFGLQLADLSFNADSGILTAESTVI